MINHWKTEQETRNAVETIIIPQIMNMVTKPCVISNKPAPDGYEIIFTFVKELVKSSWDEAARSIRDRIERICSYTDDEVSPQDRLDQHAYTLKKMRVLTFLKDVIR